MAMSVYQKLFPRTSNDTVRKGWEFVIWVMDISKMAAYKQILVDEECDLNKPIEERWLKLTNRNNAYLISFALTEAGMVLIRYSQHGATFTDNIPKQFFEIENDERAVKSYRQHIRVKG